MFTQRRNDDLEYTQAIVKLFTQMGSEFLAGRGKNPNVYGDFSFTAKAPHSQILEHAQQLWLRRCGISPISSRNKVPP